MKDKVELVLCKDIEQYKNIIFSKLGSKAVYPVMISEHMSNLFRKIEDKNIKYECIDYYEHQGRTQEIINTKECLANTFSNHLVICLSQLCEPISISYCRWNDAYLEICINSDQCIDLITNTNANNITLIGEGEDFTLNLIKKIQSIQLKKAGTLEEFNFGTLFGRDICQLSQNIVYIELLKSCKEPAKTKHFIRTNFMEPKFKQDEYFTLLNHSCSNIESINNFKEYTVLSLIGHGRDDIIWLTGSAICGRPKKMENIKSYKPLPACYYTGECFKPTEIYFPSSFMFDHYFMNACFSLKPSECLYASEFSLIYSFLDGHIASYIGSTCIIEEQENLNALYAACLTSGYSLGDIVYLLNLSYLDYKCGPNSPFFLVGNPAFTFINFVEPFDIQLVQLGVHKVKISKTALVRIVLNHEDINVKELFFKGLLRIQGSHSSQISLYISFSKENEFLIFSNQLIPEGEMLIAFNQGKEFGFTPVVYLEQLKMLKINIDNLSDYKKRCINWIGELKQQLARIDLNKEIYKAQDRLHKILQQIQYAILKGIIEDIHAKGFSFDEYCFQKGIHFIAEILSDFKCHGCGQQTFSSVYGSLMDPMFSRKYHTCSTCGIVADIPNSKNIPLQVTLDHLYRIKAGTSNEIRLMIKNDSHEKFCGFVGIAIASGHSINAEYDEIVNVDIYPGQNITIILKYKVGANIPPHLYWLKTGIILNGHIWFYKSNIDVVPQKEIVSNVIKTS